MNRIISNTNDDGEGRTGIGKDLKRLVLLNILIRDGADSGRRWGAPLTSQTPPPTGQSTVTPLWFKNKINGIQNQFVMMIMNHFQLINNGDNWSIRTGRFYSSGGIRKPFKDSNDCTIAFRFSISQLFLFLLSFSSSFSSSSSFLFYFIFFLGVIFIRSIKLNLIRFLYIQWKNVSRALKLISRPMGCRVTSPDSPARRRSPTPSTFRRLPFPPPDYPRSPSAMQMNPLLLLLLPPTSPSHSDWFHLQLSPLI